MALSFGHIAPAFDGVRGRRFVAAATALPIVCLVLASFLSPFVDHDPMIYGIVAKGIYQFGIWPYDYAFDHKPVLLYIFYLPVLLIGSGRHEFQIYSVLLVLVTTAISARFFLGNRDRLLLTLLAIVVATTLTVGFSANSELIFVPLMLLSVALFLGGTWPRIAGSAAAAVLCILTNYAAILPLAAALATVAIYRHRRPATAARSLLIYGVVAALLMAAIALLLAQTGMDLGNYLSLQTRFLRNYSSTDREMANWFKVKLVAVIAVIAVSYLWRQAKARATLGTGDHALLAIAIGSILFLFLSQKYFAHYLFAAYVSAAILFVRCVNVVKPAARWLIVALLLANLFAVYRVVLAAKAQRYDLSYSAPYKALGARVGREHVLVMRSSIVPVYYSGLYPAQPLVWPSHPRIIFGDGEDAYFVAEIAKTPRFILTAYDWCGDAGRPLRSCALVGRDYRRVIHFRGDTPVEKAPTLQTGYDLFERVERPARAPAPD